MAGWQLPDGQAPMADIRSPGEATERTERYIVMGFTLIRVVGLLLAATYLVILWHRYRWPALALAAVLTVAVESGLVAGICRRPGSQRRGRLIAADTGCTVAALAATCIAMKSSANPVTDDVLYTYSVASMAIVAFGTWRWRSVAAFPLLMAGTYAGLAVWRFGFGFGLVANALTYWAFTVPAWALVCSQRRLSRDADAARADAVARTRELAYAAHAREVQRLQVAALRAELARKAERDRTFRQLHDNVLQTLEFIARDDDADPRQLRSLITAEAAWLRSLVEGQAQAGAPGGGLAAALTAVVQRHLATGLRVELNIASIEQARPLAAVAAEAVAGAVNEALTNVRKHAGTSRAVVWAAPSDDDIAVTVLDQGRGFDAATAVTGLGLPASIRARIGEVGGSVAITSAPGAGTHVELRVPYDADAPDPAQPRVVVS